MAKIAITVIKIYQYFFGNLIRHNALPFLFPSQCRFYPSCSEYAIESINKYGFCRGSFKGIIRVLKCNPLSSCLSAAKRAQ